MTYLVGNCAIEKYWKSGVEVLFSPRGVQFYRPFSYSDYSVSLPDVLEENESEGVMGYRFGPNSVEFLPLRMLTQVSVIRGGVGHQANQVVFTPGAFIKTGPIDLRDYLDDLPNFGPYSMLSEIKDGGPLMNKIRDNLVSEIPSESWDVVKAIIDAKIPKEK